LLMAVVVRAQNMPGQEELFNPDPNAPQYKAGEVLVKFKDEVTISSLKSGGVVFTNNPGIDLIHQKWGVGSISKVFRNAQRVSTTGDIRLPDGTTKELAQLFNIYKVTFPEGKDVEQVVADYKALPEVEMAEPNRYFGVVGAMATSEPFNNQGTDKQARSSAGNPQSPSLITPNDPLYGQQWHIPNVKADSLWSYTTGDTLQVIGILDTGVDWLHPDLVNKIWRNTDEIPNNGIDDDNNGFIDDARGWDFVNDDNNPMDDNSHGTHCAGIAAAETNNGIGIAGVSWGAKIMPVKIFQSGGSGYSEQIAEGIWYAAQNGCTIFSNSWGGYGESMTIRLALEYAYSKGPIIAAAGNNGYKIDHPFPPDPPDWPMYPACYNWVLGVEATIPNGWNAWFSNYDPTGPVISDSRPYNNIFWNDNEYNYEMRAPGVSILSTVPNGQYRLFQGTSMACPVVAGSIALMKSYDPTLTNEEVFAKLIQLNKIGMFQAGVMNIKKSTLNDPPPDIYYQSFSITDSLGDKDGRPDAGETIGLFVKIKNVGGLVNPVWAKIRLAEFEDTTTVDFIVDSCYFGSVGVYGAATSFTPLTLSINSNLTDKRYVSLQIMIIYNINNVQDTVFKNTGIIVEHGIEIKGFYSSLHLKPSFYYMVTEPATIDTLIIDPGVTLRFNNSVYMIVNKKLIAIGKPDSMITFKGSTGATYRGITIKPGCENNFTYCIFEDGSNPYTNYFIENPTKIYHSIFRNNPWVNIFRTQPGGDYKYNVFVNNHSNPYCCFSMVDYHNLADFQYNVLVNNIINEGSSSGGALQFFNSPYPENMARTKHNVFMNNLKNNSFDAGLDGYWALPMNIYYLDSNYWGTTSQKDIRKHTLDFFEDIRRPVFEPRNNLIKPSALCHGIVWKALINGQNPLDAITPIVVSGRVKFDVYFNRAMDISVPPFVTFGVRIPYTQNMVNDSAFWSADSTIWTGYCNTTLKTGDGENRVRVAFAKDTDHFEIPIEDQRFKFVVQVASSQSVEFTAVPGLGKVSLEWHKDDSISTLGYNIYRYRMLTDTTFSDTLVINPVLLTDTVYVDYDVVPGLNYHYMYTVLGTDLKETDYSKVVTATPLAAANGDANADLAVNVLDITTVISYILNQNPQPFLFDAADVNNDHAINILDIIGIVNLINGKKKVGGIFAGTNLDPACIYLDSTSITFKSKGQVVALQFELTGKNLAEIGLTCRQHGFEFAHSMVKGKMIGVIYNLDNRALPEGTLDLIGIVGKPGSRQWGEVVAGDIEGNNVLVLKNVKKSVPSDDYELMAFPNPFKESVTITYTLSEPSAITLTLFTSQGQLLKVLDDQDREPGPYSLDWNGKAAPAGIYFCRLNGKTKLGKELKNEIKIVLMK